MGQEITRARYPNRKAGSPDVSRGSARKSSKEENAAVVFPSQPNVTKKHKQVAKKHENPGGKPSGNNLN